MVGGGFESLNHRGVLWIVGHQIVDALARLIGRGAQVSGVERESRDSRESVDQRCGRLGIGHRGDVVRNAGPQCHDVHVHFGESQLEGGADAGWNFKFARYRTHER